MSPAKPSSPASKTPDSPPPSITSSPGEPRLVDIVHIFSDARIRREYIEMVVFVLVLVCFLRLYGAEAYQIPTGSMAPTLLGDNKACVCPECGYHNVVNANREFHSDPARAIEGICQNCQNAIRFERGMPVAGDRVLADKVEYQWREPKRWQVVVFKYPGADLRPGARLGQDRSARDNFIKRLVGLPGEMIGIEFGDLFVRPQNSPESDFSLLRKPPRVAMATRRLVWDNDRPADDLRKEGHPARWSPSANSNWKAAVDGTSFSVEPKQAEEWIEYRHLLRPEVTGFKTPAPSLITDFETYNSDLAIRTPKLGENWVGDLMIELDVKPATDQGVFVLELVDGHRISRAEFDAQADLVRLFDTGKQVAEVSCSLSSGTSTHLVFSNFDDRLLLAVNGTDLFPEGVDLPEPARDTRGPLPADLRPVRVGTKGLAAEVSHIRLFRDIYYTKGLDATGRDLDLNQDVRRSDLVRINTPERLSSWRNELLSGRMRTFPVGPDQFFVLGDNSPQSSDARAWSRTHVVDRRLMLGRAVARYWPMIAFEHRWPVLKWKFVE